MESRSRIHKTEINMPRAVVMLKKIKLNERGTYENRLQYLPEIEDEEDVISQTDPMKEKTSTLLGHELSFILKMNKEEQNAHISKCLEMSLENKITPKNAFALQLIDCMSMLVQEKEDFSKMACTLDAGAKIYSNRVDALHKQVLKLADEVILSKKLGEKNCELNENNDSLSMFREKRKAKKKNTIASSDSLKKKLKVKDPKSKFIKFEGLPGSITNRVRRDPKDLSYSLENNLPIWKNWDQYTPSRTGGTVPLPNIKILREKDKMPNEKDTTQNYQINHEENECMIEGTVGPQDARFDEPSQESFHFNEPEVESEYDEEECLKMNEEDVGERETTTEEVGVVATAMKRLAAESDFNKVKDTASLRLDAMKLLFKEASDYHYLDMKNVHFWAGPEFWKRSKVKAEEKTKVLKNKKEPQMIVFNCDSAEVDKKWNLLFNKKTTLTHKTINAWKKNKLTLPMDLKVDISLFFELFHLCNYYALDETPQESDEDMYSSNEEEQVINTIEQVTINETELNKDIHELSGSSTNPDPLNSSFYEGIPGHSDSPDNLNGLNSAFYDVGLMKQLLRHTSGGYELGKIIGVQVSTGHEHSFNENTLVPAPKLVSFEPIKYSTRPIQVDMKHLKDTMMCIIKEEIDKDMEEKMIIPCTSVKASKPLIPQTRFSHVMKKLPSRLRGTTAHDLSISIAFLGLLTVTNENNLQLEDTGNSDVIIRFLQN